MGLFGASSVFFSVSLPYQIRTAIIYTLKYGLVLTNDEEEEEEEEEEEVGDRNEGR